MLVVLLLSVLQEVTRYAELAKDAGHLISKAQYVIRYEPRFLSQCATNTRCDPYFVSLCPLLFACFSQHLREPRISTYIAHGVVGRIRAGGKGSTRSLRFSPVDDSDSDCKEALKKAPRFASILLLSQR